VAAVSVTADTTELLLLPQGLAARQPARPGRSWTAARGHGEPGVRDCWTPSGSVKSRWASATPPSLLERAAAAGKVIRAMTGNDIHSDPLLDGMRGDDASSGTTGRLVVA
jgi:hypothetical protein